MPALKILHSSLHGGDTEIVLDEEVLVGTGYAAVSGAELVADGLTGQDADVFGEDGV